jgi:protein-S-isoprenylcysteine O-methyltransferase Ste14
MTYLDLPPIWLVLCLMLARLVPLGLPWGAAFWPGAVLLMLAVLLVLAALHAFFRARTTVIPHQQPSALITSGVFRLTRNPIYLADVLILLGLSLIWGSLLGLLLVPALFVLLERRFILAEEARLMAAFPDAFAAYCKATRRWV